MSRNPICLIPNERDYPLIWRGFDGREYPAKRAGEFEGAIEIEYLAGGRVCRAELTREEADAMLRYREPPYPWCVGYPTREACAEAGYCKRRPNCGD